jgi:hypothetical protein
MAKGIRDTGVPTLEIERYTELMLNVDVASTGRPPVCACAANRF